MHKRFFSIIILTNSLNGFLYGFSFSQQTNKLIVFINDLSIIVWMSFCIVLSSRQQN